MLKDKRISFTDTPQSIDLKIYDLIECGRVATVAKERIQIIENDNDDEDEGNLASDEITIMLQTQEGRKSRMKFLIKKVCLVAYFISLLF
jgi:hypothetical protein